MFFHPKSDPALYPYRHGLYFAFFNALNWQVGAGTPTVLFMEHLGANAFEVGLVFAWTYLLTPVQVLSTALLPRLGFKRLTMAGWGARGWFLLVPLVLCLVVKEVRVPWAIGGMVGAMFFYSLSRSIGAAAITTWLYSLVPAEVRGRYWSTDQIMAGSAAVGSLAVCSVLFALLPGSAAFFIQYLIAITGAMVAWYALNKLPDIEKPRTLPLSHVLSQSPRLMFRPGLFRGYLWLSTLFYVLSAPLAPFFAYYLKTTAGFTAAHIMFYTMLHYVGVILANSFMRSRLDRLGAKPFLRLSFATYGLLAAGWWLLLHWPDARSWALPLLYLLMGAGAGGFVSGNLNYLAKIVPDQDRALPIALHSALIAFIGGFSPVLWGLVLKGDTAAPSINVQAFQVFFAVTVAGCVLLVFWTNRLQEKTGHVEPLLEAGWLMLPFRAVTYLINLVDLNRDNSTPPVAAESKDGKPGMRDAPESRK
jgi:MFS family permease